MSKAADLSILLVEDSKITRKMEVKVLNELNFHNIIEADDGDHAIELLQSRPDIQLIISDWNMPRRGGLELLKWVRGSEHFRDVPFIMATGRAQKKETTLATEAGVSNFITKPFAPQELDAVIKDTLGGKTITEASGTQVERVPELNTAGKLIINAAHIQITDHLTLGVMKHLIETGRSEPKHFELRTHCMSSWNPVQQALEKGEVDAAFILAPIAMDLFGYGVPIRMVLLAHKNGSICVKKKQSNGSLDRFFKDKAFCIPHELSIHNMLSHMFMKAVGLRPGVPGQGEHDVSFEVVPPVKMPEFLRLNPDASGFMVAEPLGTKAIAEGTAEQLFLTGELWEYHPCCIVAMRSEIIDKHGEAVQEFISMLVEAGKFIHQKPEAAAEIGVPFLDPQRTLGLKVPILRNVLKEAQGIKTNDLFPVLDDFKRMQSYMVEEMKLGSPVDLDSFIDSSFARTACRDAGCVSYPSAIHDPSKIVSRIEHEESEEQLSSKTMLDREGKYLLFALDDQEYGIDILSIKEIIGMVPIRSIPHTPSYVKGVVNLRGKVIPVLDLRLKFDMDFMDYHDRTCIIILEIPQDGRILHIGIVVDQVSHVAHIKAEDIEAAPSFGLGRSSRYIAAMAKSNGDVKILLQTDRLLSEVESRALTDTIF